MGNLFATKPDLKPLVFPETWTDPASGITVPKNPDANMAWRLKILEAADADHDLRTDLYTACHHSLLFFVNAFVYTLRVFEPGEDGKNVQAKHQHIPFVTWPIQDEYFLRTERAITEGSDLLTDKSRDCGATWVNIATYVHRLLFRAGESHLMLSRKEDAVDQLDGIAKDYPRGSLADPGTLMGKADYILSRLPEWMLPPLSRKKLHLVNLSNKARLDGESANASAGSSDRRHSILLDEMAKMDEGEAIKQSTKDVAACRLAVSTPNGAGTAFSKWRLSGQIPVFTLPWWEVPGKGTGRAVVEDKLGRFTIRSPWYDHECSIRTPKEVATELDMDHIGSGETFFEAHVLEQHKRLFCRPPRGKCTIQFKKKLNEPQIVAAVRGKVVSEVAHTPSGPWNLWTNLVNGRPDQSKAYVLSVDIGKGQGASNSVINVSCVETREKIAEFADANTPPYELARIVCAAAIWVGGRTRHPLVIYENNGDAGLDFGRQFVLVYKYPNVYFDRQHGTLRQKVGKRYGWRSSTDKKAEALGLLRRAYAHGQYINHSTLALVEASTYVHYEGGGIGPAELVAESDSARKAHGDRVIADMLAVWVIADAGRIRKVDTAKPERSIGGRMRKWVREKKANKLDGHMPRIGQVVTL